MRTRNSKTPNHTYSTLYQQYLQPSLGQDPFLCAFPYSTDGSRANSGIEMRASRQKGVWSHLSAGQYPWEAIVIFFPAFVHKAVLDYKQAYYQLLSVYSLGGGGGGSYGAGRLCC